MSVFFGKDSFRKSGKGLSLATLLLGSSAMIVGLGIVHTAKADENKVEAQVFSSWVDEDALRASVVAEVAEVVAEAGTEALPVPATVEVPAFAEVADEFAPDLAESATGMRLVNTVEVPQAEVGAVYAPEPVAVAVADAPYPASASASAPATARYGKIESPWKNKELASARDAAAGEVALEDSVGNLTARDRAIRSAYDNGDVDTLLSMETAESDQPIGAMPQYTDFSEYKGGVQVKPISSSSYEEDPSVPSYPSYQSKQRAVTPNNQYDKVWAGREEAAGWFEITEIEEDKVPKTGADEVDEVAETVETLDWVAASKDAKKDLDSVLKSISEEQRKAAKQAPKPPITAGISSNAKGATGDLVIAPDGMVVPVIQPEELVAKPPVIPSKPLLVPMDIAGGEGGFNAMDGVGVAGFGADGAAGGNAPYNYEGVEYSYSSGNYAPAVGAGIGTQAEGYPVAPVSAAARFTGSEGSAAGASTINKVKDWFSSVMQQAGKSSNTALDSVLSRYSKSGGGALASSQAGAASMPFVSRSELRIAFDEGTANMAAGTVRQLKDFAAAMPKSGRGLEIMMGKDNLSLQARRFAIIRGALVSGGVPAAMITPVLAAGSGNTVVVKSVAVATSGSLNSLSAMGRSF